MSIQCLLPGFRFFFFACKRMTANTTTAASTAADNILKMGVDLMAAPYRQSRCQSSPSSSRREMGRRGTMVETACL